MRKCQTPKGAARDKIDLDLECILEHLNVLIACRRRNICLRTWNRSRWNTLARKVEVWTTSPAQLPHQRPQQPRTTSNSRCEFSSTLKCRLIRRISEYQPKIFFPPRDRQQQQQRLSVFIYHFLFRCCCLSLVLSCVLVSGDFQNTRSYSRRNSIQSTKCTIIQIESNDISSQVYCTCAFEF